MSAPRERSTYDVISEEFAVPEELRTDRDAEATTLCAAIVGAGTPFIVLHGPADSGKTEMVRQRLMPLLAAATPPRDVYYAKCREQWPRDLKRDREWTSLDAIAATPSIAIIDSFDRVLDLPRDQQAQELEALFDRMRHAHPAFRLVLIVDERQLNAVYALESYDSAITAVMRRVRSISAQDAFSAMMRELRHPHLRIDPAVVSAVADDCVVMSRSGSLATLPLVRVIVAWAVAYARENGVESISKEDYDAVGGTQAVLRAHVERRFDDAAAAVTRGGEIGRAILEHLRELQEGMQQPDLDGLATRIGVPRAEIDLVIRALVKAPELIRRRPFGILRIQPPQASVIIEQDLAAHEPSLRRAQRLLADGLREWETSGRLLSESRFGDVHAERRYLNPTRDESLFLLESALRQDRPDLVDAADYWLARVPVEADRRDVVLRATYNESEILRRRACRLLLTFADEVAASRLVEVAMTDDDADARDAAIAALRVIGTKRERDALLEAASSSRDQYRMRAIQVLRAFDDPTVIDVLGAAAGDANANPEIRVTAIASLAALDSEAAFARVIDSALAGPTEADRDAARTALASVRDADRARQALDTLAVAPDWRRRAGRFALFFAAMGALVVGIGMAGAMWDELDAHRWLAPVYLILMSGLLLPLARDVKPDGRGDDSETIVARLRTVLSFIAASITILPIVHGLAHFAIGRRPRAAQLFWSEVLGVVLIIDAEAILAPYATTDSLMGRVCVAARYVFFTAGVVLFVWSYFIDVRDVVLGTFILRRSMTLHQRRVDACASLMSNGHAAGLVAGALGTDQPATSWSPRKILTRFARNVPTSVLLEWLQGNDERLVRFASHALMMHKTPSAIDRLGALYRTAQAATRRRIASVLWTRPTERSIECLEQLQDGMTRSDRLRVRIARWSYPIFVWPRAVRLTAVVLLPSLLLLFYAGWHARSDPGWSLIVSLRAEGSPQELDREADVVDFLSTRQYARTAAPYLVRLLAKVNNRAAGEADRLHASLVSGLAGMDPAATARLKGLVAPLAGGLSRYQTGLRSPDSLMQMTSIGVLARIIRGQNARYANLARTEIAHFITDAGNGTVEGPQARRAIEALHGLPVTTLLVTLDTLYARSDSDRWIRTMVYGDISRVADSATSAVIDDEHFDNRDALLTTLKSLHVAGTNLTVKRAIDRLEKCDVDHDGRCTWQEHASLTVAQYPTEAFGYNELLSHYVAHRALSEARDTLQAYVTRYPNNVWPRKSLASLMHEQLGPTNPAYFDSSYAEMTALRELPAYQAMRRQGFSDYDAVEHDFVEVALSARQYAVVDTLAARHASASEDPAIRYNMVLFQYFSAVMQGRRDAARGRLDAVDSILADGTRKSQFNNTWLYPGTVAFLKSSARPASLRDAMIALCKSGRWTADDRTKVVQQNRRALATTGA